MTGLPLRDGLDSLLADEPPLGFDPDGIPGRVVRRKRRRQAVAGATALTVVLVVGAFLVRNPGPTTSEPAREVGYSDQYLFDRGGELADLLVAKVPAVAPQVTEVKLTNSWVSPGGRQMAIGHAWVGVGEQFGELEMAVFGPGALPGSSPDLFCAEREKGLVGASPCSAEHRPDGSWVVRIDPWSGDASRSSEVRHYRVDGTVVTAEVDGRTDPATHEVVSPLTLDQLQVLATDPEFRL